MDISRSEDLSGWLPLLKSASAKPYLCANCKRTWWARRVTGINSMRNATSWLRLRQIRRRQPKTHDR